MTSDQELNINDIIKELTEKTEGVIEKAFEALLRIKDAMDRNETFFEL